MSILQSVTLVLCFTCIIIKMLLTPLEDRGTVGSIPAKINKVAMWIIIGSAIVFLASLIYPTNQ